LAHTLTSSAITSGSRTEGANDTGDLGTLQQIARLKRHALLIGASSK
jgi:hypothetical protein